MNEVAIELFTQNELSGKIGTYLLRPTSEITPSNLSASGEKMNYSTQESPVAAELRALSQPRDGGPISRYPNYVYPAGGIQSYIYHVEFGINREHQEFHGRDVEWLYTDLAIREGANTRTEAATGRGHSTCTASKAVGNLYGASKNATLVVVKMPNLGEASVYEVLDSVIHDVRSKKRTATSVVSMSWGRNEMVKPGLLTTLERRLEKQLNELIGMGVTIVCAAGNEALKPNGRGGTRLFIDTIPAYLAERSYDRLIAVGNSDINGVRHPSSQEFSDPVWIHRPLIHAPGVDIKCASSTAPMGYRIWTGTSFCMSPLRDLWFLTDRSISSRTSCSRCHRRSDFRGAISSQTYEILARSVLVEKGGWPIRCMELSW